NGFIQKVVTSPYHPAWGEAVYLSIHAIQADDPVLASLPTNVLEKNQPDSKTGTISYIDAYNQSEIEHLQTRLGIYLALANELKAELDQEKNISQTLQTQLEQERSQHQSDQEKLHWLETEVEHTQGRLQIYLAVSEELKTELDTLKSEKPSQSDQYIAELNQVKQELELTRSQLAETEQELLVTKEKLKLSPTQGIPANYHTHIKALAKIIAETLPES
ncbi:MAG: hypothetical protein ACRDB1_03125, partial [Microcoleaceae cyanobacterium]